MSGNPLAGSEIEISYTLVDLILEVQSLREYVDSYKGGRGDIRSMEGMIQAITQDCANAVKTTVHVFARLNINPDQRMELECSAHRK
jgi:NADPH-dependent 7-cyano-7-deazaguanine reductase QueF-like protein